jgi:hypothetical protein
LCELLDGFNPPPVLPGRRRNLNEYIKRSLNLEPTWAALKAGLKIHQSV